MSEFRLVEAAPEHLAAILGISGITNAEHAGRQPDSFFINEPNPLEVDLKAHFKRGILPRTTRLFVCLDQSKVVGHVFVQYRDTPHGGNRHDRTASIDDISVLPDYRRRGVGQHLLDRAVAEAGKDGATNVVALVWQGNSPSEAMFGGHGFARKVSVFDKRLADPLDGHAPVASSKITERIAVASWLLLAGSLGAAAFAAFLTR